MGLPKRSVRNVSQFVSLLQEKYPTHNWDKMFTLKGRFGQQRRLEQAVASLFPVPHLPSLMPLGWFDLCNVDIGSTNYYQRKKGDWNTESCNWPVPRTRCLYTRTKSRFRISGNLHWVILVTMLIIVTYRSGITTFNMHHTHERV